MFLFFGVVAVTGTFFAQMEELNWESFVLAVPVGLLATAILMVNNIRDLETDRRAGKKTLAVRLGRPRARVGYALVVYLAFATAPLAWAFGGEHLTPWLLLPWLALPIAAPIVRIVRNRVDGPSLNGALARTGHAPARVLRPPLGRPPAVAVIGLTVRTERFPLRIKASWGEMHEREVLIVRLDHPDGTWGEGEAAPLEPYDGVSISEVRAALDAYATRSSARSSRPPTCSPPAPPSATSRRRSRRSTSRCGTTRRAARETPLAKLIDPRAVGSVPVNATIGAEDRAGAAAAAAEAARDGFRCVKVKVGVGDDAGRIAAVRAAVGPEVGIRIDANGAWDTPEYALANLRALAPVGLELCEEPVHGVEALRAVRAGTTVPIAMDETHEPGSGAADVVCLKITRGGITGVLHDARAAREPPARTSTSRRRSTGRAGSPPPSTSPPRCGSRARAVWRPARSTAHDGVIDVPLTPGLA